MPSVRHLARDDQRQLAWTLIDLMRPQLPRRMRIDLVVMIGAGEIECAIMDLIAYGTQIDIEVPDSLVDSLHDWARGYRGTPLERMLRVRINAFLISSEQPARSRRTPASPTLRRRRVELGSVREEPGLAMKSRR